MQLLESNNSGRCFDNISEVGFEMMKVDDV